MTLQLIFLPRSGASNDSKDFVLMDAAYHNWQESLCRQVTIDGMGDFFERKNATVNDHGCGWLAGLTLPTRSRMSLNRKGLSRKPKAPAASASSRVSLEPCPVMMMTGI